MKIFYRYNQTILVRITLLIAIIIVAFRFSPQFWQPEKPAIVIESPTIQTIFSLIKPTEYNESTCVIFDIDNTLARPHGHLGSDQWFRWLIDQYEKSGKSRHEAVELVMPRLLEIMNYIWMEPVESITPQVIKELQERGVTVIALTARSLDLTYRTISQLDHIGITFAVKGPRHCPIIYGTGKPALYIDGILFSGNYKKGEVIAHWFDQINYHPKKVIFVDDLLHNIESVKEALHRYHYSFIGIRYSHLDPFVKTFDPQELEEEYVAFKKAYPESRPIGAMTPY